MTTREQNRNNKRREIERFDWFVERIQTCVAFGWLSERSGEKTSLTISTSPIIHFVCVFFAPNTRKQFCIRTVFILSWDVQSSREKCKQYVWKTTCVCWGGGQETCKQSVLREMRKWLHARKLSRNQSMLRFDFILQRDWPIEQCLLHIRIFLGGKTKRTCFDLFIQWLIKQITNTYRNHFSRSYEDRSNIIVKSPNTLKAVDNTLHTWTLLLLWHSSPFLLIASGK